jgi:hypothetical protein
MENKESKREPIADWPNGKPPVRKFRFSRGGGELLNVRDDGPVSGKSGAQKSRSTYLGDNSLPSQNVDDVDW